MTRKTTVVGVVFCLAVLAAWANLRNTGPAAPAPVPDCSYVMKNCPAGQAPADVELEFILSGFSSRYKNNSDDAKRALGPLLETARQISRAEDSVLATHNLDVAVQLDLDRKNLTADIAAWDKQYAKAVR